MQILWADKKNNLICSRRIFFLFWERWRRVKRDMRHAVCDRFYSNKQQALKKNPMIINQQDVRCRKREEILKKKTCWASQCFSFYHHPQLMFEFRCEQINIFFVRLVFARSRASLNRSWFEFHLRQNFKKIEVIKRISKSCQRFQL